MSNKELRSEILSKTIDALRSGKYVQGRGRLNINNEEFCCLGVICEVAMGCGVELKKRIRRGIYSYDGSSVILPSTVADLLDVSAEGTFLNDDCDERALSAMNDSGMTFSEIAKVIEKVEKSDRWVRRSHD